MDPKIQNLKVRIKNVQIKMSRLMDDIHAAREKIKECLAENLNQSMPDKAKVAAGDLIVSNMYCTKSPSETHVFIPEYDYCMFCHRSPQ